MSIESARLALRNETIEAVTIGQMKQPWYIALDALILEAQAAMPCAATWVNERLVFRNSGFSFQQCPDGGANACPSCQAKARLAAKQPTCQIDGCTQDPRQCGSGSCVMRADKQFVDGALAATRVLRGMRG